MKFAGFLRILLLFTFVFLSIGAARAQTLKAGDIIYSRLPVAPDTIGTIWAVGQNGTDDRQIAVGDQPRLSPNERYLLFRRSTGAFDSYRNGQLWVRDLVTNTETMIYSYGDFVVGYFFTPDSAQIVFDSATGLFKMNRDGTNITSFTAAGNFSDFPVSRTSDGLIAFHNYNGGSTAGIYTINPNNTNLQKVPNTLNDLFPSWSADGQFIAYGTDNVFPVAYPYEIENLFKIKPDGTSKLQLTTLTGADRIAGGFAWTAGGDSKLIAAASIGGVAGLYSVNTDGSGATTMIPITAGANPDFVGAIVATPTAASVSIGGRVLTASGGSIGGVSVTLTNADGETRFANTNPFGFYHFQDVPAGQSYIIKVKAKRFDFKPDTRLINLFEELTDIDFIGALF